MTEATSTTFGSVVIPEAPKQAESPKPAAGAKPLSRYMKNKLAAQKLAEHSKAKRQAKRDVKKGIKPSKPDGKLSKKALKVAQRTQAVKRVLKSKGEPDEKKSGSLFGTCSFCGKPLTRPSSVSQGMGDFCAHSKGMLPAGVTRDEHIETLTVTELPKGYMKLGDAYHAARKAGFSGSRFMQACGGNGQLRKPLNEHFKFVFYKNTRYVPETVLKHFKDMVKK